jgi:hypothetical protein
MATPTRMPLDTEGVLRQAVLRALRDATPDASPAPRSERTAERHLHVCVCVCVCGGGL